MSAMSFSFPSNDGEKGNKRKKEWVYTEDFVDTSVKIIYHTCPKYVECVCGEIIKGEYAHHICLTSLNGKRNLKIYSCTPKCEICIAWMDEQSNKQIYLKQWTEDYENVYRMRSDMSL